ncbi:MAG: N-acetylglucosamine-6-phosphate deacetylase [Thermoanaerobaculia bacterium]|nr:N-acetylglucosamine-6-phosphate deacetylase [Thermoanaerobaculia bacterium]
MRRFWGRAFVDGRMQERTLITIDDEQIVDVTVESAPPPSIDGTGDLIVPGFVDLHVHGGDGADFMDGADEAVGRVTSFHARNGTTALAATTLSGSRTDLREAVMSIARASRAESRGAEICGVHLEGPYINAKRAGAQNVSSIRPADIQEIELLLSEASQLKWMITVAPEIEGVRALIEHFRGRIAFSIGHTAADYGEAVAALDWGAGHFTHLFNAMTGMHHREPGVVGAALVSVEATAELIADGIHVHPAVLRVATRAMPNRIALVTDAVRASGMPAGNYRLYEHEFAVSEDGAARLADGTLAGSTLTMNRAVQNMVELAGLPLEMVLPLATEVPARILGVSERKGKIARGYDADLVFLTPKFDVEKAIVRGREVA